MPMRSTSIRNPDRNWTDISRKSSRALALGEKDFILDGSVAGRFSFDDLLRIDPAASRVKKLAVETPALFLAFDLLLKGGSDRRVIL